MCGTGCGFAGNRRLSGEGKDLTKLRVCVAALLIALLFLGMIAAISYFWFVKKYLGERKLSVKVFRRRLKDYYEYRRELKQGKKIPSGVLADFWEQKQPFLESSVIRFWEAIACLVIAALFSGSVLAAVLSLFKGNQGIAAAIFVASCLIGCAVDFWKKYKNTIVLYLDAYNRTMAEFSKLLKKENSGGGKFFAAETGCYEDNLSASGDSQSEAAEKQGGYARDILLWVTVFLSFAIGVAVLYPYVTGENSWENLWLGKVSFSPFHLILAAGTACDLMLISIYIESGNHRIANWLQERKRRKEKIQIVEALKPWEEKIRRMCSELGIRSVQFFVFDGTGAEWAVSEASWKENYQIICLDSYCLKELEAYFGYAVSFEMISFVLGHELSHIQTGDSSHRIRRRVLFFCGVIYMSMLLLFMSTCLRAPTGGNALAISCMFGLFLIGFTIVTHSFSDNRFWGQLYELRADRTGIQVSRISEEQFCMLADFFEQKESLHTCNSDAQRRGQSKRVDEDMYPSWETRKREIQKYGKRRWKTREYFRYAVRFSWKLKILRDWRL